MALFDIFRNYINSLVGNNQEWEQLLAAKDISAIKERMAERSEMIADAAREYDTASHSVTRRPDKVITDKRGNPLRTERTWKLPVPYPVYINEISLVFLYGRPVKWTQLSEGTDRAFAAFKDAIKRTRFDSKVRQCKRLAGAETESALLFRVYRDDDGRADVQARVLARSKGDEIYVRRDQYENILAIAWGYRTREEKEKLVYHFDVFTKEVTYRCKQKGVGWEVVEEPNLVGKIPIILFQQEKEWAGVEPLIEREEMIASHTADVNDYFADPIMVVSAEAIKNLPEKKEIGKLIAVKDADGVDKVVRYLTWDNAPQSKKDELEWLQSQILSKTFTPNITLDALKSMSSMSAKALRTVMMLADIKAARHKEQHDELLDRTASLLTAIVGNVLDVSLASECARLVVGHEFQEPFGEDIADDIANIVKAVDGGVMSTETAVELNPLVKDPAQELRRLSEQAEADAQTRLDIFGGGEGAGPQSYGNGNANKSDKPEKA